MRCMILTKTLHARTLALVALVGFTMLVVPAADAAKRRTDRQRITTLEKQVRSLRTALKDTNASLMDAYDVALDAFENSKVAFQSLQCMQPLEMNELVFTLPGAETPLLAFQPAMTGKTPDFYTVEIDVKCLAVARSPILANFAPSTP